MVRFNRFGMAVVVIYACVGSGIAVGAAPTWQNEGRVYEVSDMPSVVVAPRAAPIDGQPALPPEPESGEALGLPVPADVVTESAEVPSLSDRVQQWGERALSPPGVLTYDSAVSVEADGTVVPCSTQGSLRDCLPCLDGGCWIVRAEALALWRNAPASRPLFTTLSNYDPGPPASGVLGPTALDARQLESDPLAAGRLSLARIDDCGRGFDAGYLWAGNFYSRRSLPVLANGYALAAPGIYGNSWGLIPPAPPISVAEAQLVSSLQSAEINYREPLGWGATRFLVGFRWLQWREAFSMTDGYVDPLDPTVVGADFWKTSCLNNLYGGQIGLDSMLWNSGKGLRLEGLVKAGAYYSAATQSSGYYYANTAPFQSPYATITLNSPATCSFVGEVGLTGVVPLRKNLDLRCGYFGLWLTSLAQPTRQLSGQTLDPTGALPPSGTLTSNGSVVLQGVSLGLEGRW